MISPIEKYDQELEQDIKSLEKYIDKDEKLAKTYFQNLGCPKEIADEIAREERARGKHMYFGYPACIGTDELLESLKELHQTNKILPFRIYLIHPITTHWDWGADWLSIEIIIEDGSFRFNATTLSDSERRAFVDHMHVLFRMYYVHWSYEWGIHHCYPSLKLAKFVADMLMKYKVEQILSKNPVRDERAWSLWGSKIEES